MAGFSTDEISRITYLLGAKSGDYAYETLDFSRIVTGIVEVEIIAGNAGEVFLRSTKFYRTKS